MIRYLIATLICTAILLAPTAANSNSDINAVSTKLKVSSMRTFKTYSQFADSNFNANSQTKRQLERVYSKSNKQEVNFALIAVALICFVLRANRGRV